MDKPLHLTILLVMIVLAIITAIYRVNADTKLLPPPGQIVLYTSSQCPHCVQVKKFLDQNKVASKVKFEVRRVDGDMDNTKKLVAQAKLCGIKGTQVPIPLLWSGKGCVMGDKNIISFFKRKIAAKPNATKQS